MKATLSWRVCASAIAASFLTLAPAKAAVSDEFYRGRTIFVVVGYAAGGGYDLNARVLAQFLGKHIAGTPTVVVQNMPGAGSLKAANYIFSVAPKNGTYIGTFARGMGSATLMGQASFDARQFGWLGSIAREGDLCISWSASKVRTWNDVMASGIRLGGEGAEGDPDIFAKLYKNLLGAKIKLATGFYGSSDIILAMQRGEVDGMCGISWSTIKSHYATWITEKKINVLLQASTTKDPELPNVPLASDLARNFETREVLDFVAASQGMARPFAAPPGIPEDRKAILRKAFDDTMNDPAFRAAAAKLLLDVDPATGAQVDALVASLYATPKNIVAEARHSISN